MNTVTRLALYGAGLVLVFGVMFFAGRALVPDDTVATWTREAEESSAEHEEMEAVGQGDGHDQASGHEDAGASHVRGLSVEQDGYRLSPVDAPDRAGEEGQLSFQVIGSEGVPLTDFAINHQKRLHLIAVRSDGAGFQHLHPSLDPGTGTWSVPVTWPEGGTYRVFTDFVPGGSTDAPDVTLGRSVEVAGKFSPASKPLSRTDSVDGFDVSLAGTLNAGKSDELTVTVSRDGKPETHLEPYLGAFGHLVALREGDLAFLHVHAEEDHAESDRSSEADDEGHSHGSQMAGPEIGFVAEVPTAGRYLLYLDFKVGGEVHTAEFVLEAK